MIPFNQAAFFPKSMRYMEDCLRQGNVCGDKKYTKQCKTWLENQTGSPSVFLTTSGTHALEMAALLAGIEQGDEVIMPSYTFTSTANAFVLRGATIVFVDIRPDTMNIDENLIEEAITKKTKSIVPMHYAGVSCEMDTILSIGNEYGICVIEDAAQGVMASYKGQALGSLGDYGCYSFHETKNYSMGEGGAVLIRDLEKAAAAEILREKGTNRSQFLRGQIDKYTWQDKGSSYLPSDLNAAYLYSQLEVAEEINKQRLECWHYYYKRLETLQEKGKLQLPCIPKECKHNAHMFYIKVRDLGERSRLIAFLKGHGVTAVFHYIPLHTAPAGRKFGRFAGEDTYTTKESERLVRLPMYYGLEMSEVDNICDLIENFFTE